MRVGSRTARETFADAQERHRRAGRRIATLGVVAVVLVGLPLSVVVSPVAAATAVILADLVNLAVPTPDLGALAHDTLLGLGDVGPAWHVGPLGLGWLEGLVSATALVLPGVALMLLTWRCVRRMFLRSGPEALVLAARARPPDGSVEERRLVNLVEEMAIASGILPPTVMVVDDDTANAAVVGRSVDDCVLLVPRNLLTDLGRAPAGAVVADLIALVLGGNLSAALLLASIMQTFDLVGAVLAAPTSRRTRAVLWRTARYGLRRGREGDPAEAQFIVDHLAALGRGEAELEPARGCLVGLVQLPFLIASLTFQLTRSGPGRLLLDPLLAAMWHRRRLLADATAVQLTRDPGALARALGHLRDKGADVPEGPWPHLFLLAPTDAPTGPAVTGGSAHAELVAFLPPLDERLRRLHAMGARPDLDPAAPVVPAVPVTGGADDPDAPFGPTSRTGSPPAPGSTPAAGAAPDDPLGAAASGDPLGTAPPGGGTGGAEPPGWEWSAGTAGGPGALRRLGRGTVRVLAWPARLVAATALLAVTAVLVYVSLVVDAVVLAPLVALVHVILR